MTFRTLSEFLDNFHTTNVPYEPPFVVGEEIVARFDAGSHGLWRDLTWPLRVVRGDAPPSFVLVECMPLDGKVIFFGTAPIEKSRCMHKDAWMFLRRFRMYQDARTKRRRRNASRVRRRERATGRSILEINETWGMR